METIAKEFATMKLSAFLISSVFFSLTACAAEKNVNTPTSSTIDGLWQVTQVNIDNETTRTLSYQLNDPRLLGRVINISTKSIENNLPEKDVCTAPTLSIERSTLNQFIGKSMGGDKSISAKNYALKENGQAEVSIFKIACHSGSFGPSDNGAGSSFAALNPKKMLVNWYDGSLLQLERLPKDPKPAASFDCAKSTSVVEKTICSDFNLSAYDKSVSQAWLLAKKQATDVGDKKLAASLNSTQRSWLLQRDKCRDDKDCLADTMQKRIDALTSHD
ncbi:lysozyme inhibitor LprI family protein [Serratia surfactantfaciens]|uniref:lysozyme inhibitor LprI family protein n=1 Tax=Serratia surfactantfaciens TaxID=2741499 RepID=UPI001FD436B0|nr:lysozyme inhibitor LprI family protein [Serratia surfactantfaciens]